MNKIAHFHLPGLFEFYDFYSVFLPVFSEHREYFYDWCDIASIYGSSGDCLWGGGRVENGTANPENVFALLQSYGISARLTFSNSLLKKNHLVDKKCNSLCKIFQTAKVQSGIIIHSDLLLEYLRQNYPQFYFVSSTTKVLTNFDDFEKELNGTDFKFVVPDFRLNKMYKNLDNLTPCQKNKVEFLCNECCWIGCKERKICYETVSRKNLGETCSEHICKAPGGNHGYKFSLAMKNPSFISLQDIQDFYIPHGFSNFKIEGRGLGSAILLEFLLYYLTKPEYQLQVREALYLDSMLDLF